MYNTAGHLTERRLAAGGLQGPVCWWSSHCGVGMCGTTPAQQLIHWEPIIPAQVSWCQSSVGHGVIMLQAHPVRLPPNLLLFSVPSLNVSLRGIVSYRFCPWPACTRVLFLCLLIFSAPLTFNLFHSWRTCDSRPVFLSHSRTTSCHSSAVFSELYI